MQDRKYDNGINYQGDRNKAGSPHGKWIINYDNGYKYEGDCVNGKPTGKGKLFYKNNFIGKVEYKKGKFKINYESGDKYEGDFQNGKRHGKGTLYYEDGDKYEGDFQNGKRHGKGTLYYEDGDKYEGDFKDGDFEGKGIYYYNDGEKYEGDFKNGLFEGKGIFYYKDGEKYEGYWRNDKKEGKGIIYYANGNKQYEGEFENGKKEGKGIYYYEDGGTYDGGWKNGERHGKGTRSFKNGDKYKGEWKNGKLLNKREIRKTQADNRKVVYMQINELDEKSKFLDKYTNSKQQYEYIKVNDKTKNVCDTSKANYEHLKIYYEDHGGKGRDLDKEINLDLFTKYQNEAKDLKSIYISSVACHGGFYDGTGNTLFEETKKIMKNKKGCIGFVSLNKKGNTTLFTNTKNKDESCGVKRSPANKECVNLDDVGEHKDDYFEYYCIINKKNQHTGKMKQNIYRIPQQLCYWREYLIEQKGETHDNKFIEALDLLKSGKDYKFTTNVMKNGKLVKNKQIVIPCKNVKIEKVKVKKVKQSKTKTDYKQYRIKAVNNDKPLSKTNKKDNLHK